MTGVSVLVPRPAGRRRPIRVLAADAQPLFLDALARAIRRDRRLELVEESGDRESLIAAIGRSSPDVALIDSEMLGGGIADVGPSTKIVVLASEVHAAAAYTALERGAAGYLSKDLEADVICRAVGRVARGETVLDASAQTGVAAEIRLRVHDERPVLSAREHQILVLMADGHTAPDIARRLHVSLATIKTHQLHLYTKLGVAERAAAVAQAMRLGLLE